MPKKFVNEKENAALDKFAELMIEKIKSIQKNWHKPWFTTGIGAWPVNPSGREYNGCNAMLLMWMCEKNSWHNPVFGTFDRFAKYNYIFDKEGCQVPARDKDPVFQSTRARNHCLCSLRPTPSSTAKPRRRLTSRRTVKWMLRKGKSTGYSRGFTFTMCSTSTRPT